MSRGQIAFVTVIVTVAALMWFIIGVLVSAAGALSI